MPWLFNVVGLLDLREHRVDQGLRRSRFSCVSSYLAVLNVPAKTWLFDSIRTKFALAGTLVVLTCARRDENDS